MKEIKTDKRPCACVMCGAKLELDRAGRRSRKYCAACANKIKNEENRKCRKAIVARKEADRKPYIPGRHGMSEIRARIERRRLARLDYFNSCPNP